MRVVLDTNTVVSAMLFSGVASRLVPLWQSRRLVVLVSRPIVDEYYRVFAYPKYQLDSETVRALVEEEILPFSKVVRPGGRIHAVERDPDDDKFLECAVAGKATYLISGDRALLELVSYRGIPIITAGAFLRVSGVESTG